MRLRPISLDDADQLLRWRNSPEVARWMFDARPISPSDHIAWLQARLDSPGDRYWIIESDGRDVGLVHLDDVESADGTASWGLYIGDPSARGRGVATAALTRVLEIAFDELHLSKVRAEVLESNAPSLALHERLGFTRAGEERDRILFERVPSVVTA
jgi:UDP-4-amino-4,6-dideoxy-N-acetyl-beta-L-altrosamine N-acetyltransferase